MRKARLSVLLSFALTVSLVFGSASVFAVDVDSTATAGMTGGALTFTPESVNFPTGTISSSGTVVVLEDSVNNRIKDDRGNADGWVVSLSSTPLVSAAVPDRTAGDGDTIQVAIPADRLSVAVWSVYRELDHGMQEHPVHGPLSVTGGSELTLGSSPVALVRADPGYGMGEYILNLNFLFRAPKAGTIHSISNPDGSAYEIGQTIGLVAATYTATFTYTVSSGL